jgi:hypothetical protein
MDQCNHIIGRDGSTIVVHTDGCSLACTVCKKVVLPLEPIGLIFGPNTFRPADSAGTDNGS